MLVSWSLFVPCILYLRLPKFQLSPAPKEALDLFEKEFFPTSELIAWTEGFNRSQPYPEARFSGLARSVIDRSFRPEYPRDVRSRACFSRLLTERL